MLEENFRKNLSKLRPYKPGKSEEEIKKEYGITEIIKLGSNENPYGCSEKVKDILREEINTNIYPDNYVYYLRKKLSEKYKIGEENFIFGNGSVEILQMICRIMLDADDEVLTCKPTFQSYKSECIIQNAKIVEVPLKKHKFDLQGILEKITEKTKIIFICNPNNPTGTIITEEEQKEFLSKVPKNILVLLDEAYYEYVTSEEYPKSINMLKEYENICILRTFSKAYGLAGLRIGYGIASKKIIEELEKVRVPFNISEITQKSAYVALEDEEFIKKCNEKNNEVKEYIYENLEKNNIEYIKTQANFIMINVQNDGVKIANKLLEKGIIVRPGFEDMGNFIRVTIGTKEEMQIVLEELNKIIKQEAI